MINNPKISVITVVFNGKRFIEKTIQSVISQTYSNIEYIIIDGASTDGTIDIIKKYEDKIDYWVSEADNGIYDAMNKGIEVASGDWEYFLNAGDVFYDRLILDKLFKKKLYNDIDIVYGSVVIGFGKKIFPKRLNRFNFISTTPICHQAIFYKSKIIKKYKYNLSYKIIADYEQLFRIFNMKKFFLNSNFVIARVEKFGVSGDSFWLIWKERFIIISKFNIIYLPFLAFHFTRVLMFRTVRKLFFKTQL